MERKNRFLAVGFFAALLVLASGCPGGEAAKPCTVTTDAAGKKTLSCPDGTTATINDGTNGTNGASCTVVDNGNNTKTITCGTMSVTVANGTKGIDGTNGDAGRDGTSCTVSAVDAGLKRITCTDGTSVTVVDGVNANAIVDFSTMTAAELAAADFQVTIGGVTNAPRPVVTITVRDVNGRGIARIPPGNFSGMAVLQLVPGSTAAGAPTALDTWVSHITNCATCTASSETATATSLVDNGTGTYVYTFAKDIVNPTAYDGGMAIAGVAFDANAPHRFGLRLAATGNTFRPVDAVHDYIPATGANILGQNDKVNTANCLECHMQFRANPLNAGGVLPFHNGQRYDTRYCVVCHNDQRKFIGSNIAGNPVYAEPTIDGVGNMTPPAGQTAVRVIAGEAVINLPVWVHKIHRGKELYLKGNYTGLGAEINEVAFPQDLRNCAKCHKNAAQADNWKNKPSRRACGACHDRVDFVTGNNHGPANSGGARTDDSLCSVCHTPAAVATRHIPVVPIDPRNIFSMPVGGSSNTNASSLGNPFNPPPGATVFRYSMPANAVSAVPTADGGFNAQVVFKFMTGDAGVAFNAWDGGNELMDNFVGSPSVYCAFAVPQDGIAAPADFNASVSGYLKNIWKGTATGTGAGTFSGPDTNGNYTVRLTGVTIPPAATMLTCGLGYTYSLSATQPLTQTNVTGYDYDAGSKVGGIGIPVDNIWQVATGGPDGGYIGRRGATTSSNPTGQIVNPDKCNNCHNRLGVSPTFHGGQRNNGPTCAFCHTPNRTSSGWSAGSGSFIHAIHGAGKRSIHFNWHAISEDEGFFAIAFPGRPQMCEGCHNPGYYDFSASWYSDANQARRLVQTVAQGKYNGLPSLADGGVNTAVWSLSPYVIQDNVFSYDAGFSYNTATGVTVEAAGNTLVNSQIANSCFGCHDLDRSVMHMRSNGGRIYEPRSSAVPTTEQCVICHGPGKIAAIKSVHYQ